MDDLIRVTKSIKRLLAEAELKNIISKLKKGDMVQMTLEDGTHHMYTIEVIHGNDFLIRDSSNKENLFTFNVSDYTDKGLIMYQYSNRKKGKQFNYPNVKLTMGTPTGSYYNIDPIDLDLGKFDYMKNPEVDEKEPEGPNPSDMFDDMKKKPEVDDNEIESDNAQQELDAMNQNILDAKKGDNLHFTINVSEDSEVGSEKDNNVVLEISNITEENIECFLTDINGPISALLTKWLNNKNLVINKSNLIKVEEGELVLDIMDIDSKQKITLPSIDWVGLNKYEHPIDSDDDSGQHTLSQQELNDIMMDNPKIADYWLKQSGAAEALFGASPIGRYTIAQQMKQMNLEMSYLTKGSIVKFRVLNNKKIGTGFDKTLDPAHKEGYGGIMVDDNTMIARGKINNRHWVITLRKKVKGQVYEVNYQYCTNRDECQNKGGGTIELIDINNDKVKGKRKK